jgi:hypothetical protein
MFFLDKNHNEQTRRSNPAQSQDESMRKWKFSLKENTNKQKHIAKLHFF